jgi:sirohydrochlorin cobaltochelatase
MNMAFPPGVGVLVVGHGTADPVGAGETRSVAAAVADLLPGVPVELGFLEVIGPTIAESLGRLAARGCREIIAAPLLLFAAGHAKRDVPEAIAAGAATHGLRVVQAEPFGCHREILQLSRTRRQEAVASLPSASPAETVLVVIGRGSSDPGAVPQLRSFVEASLAGDPLGRPRRIELGFVAAAQPRLDDALRMAGDPTDPLVRRILVQPHLLFRGHVEEQVTEAVQRGRVARPDLEWVQVSRLGADPLVALAVAERVAEAAGMTAASKARFRGETLSRQGSCDSSQ